jgi:putative transcriptional regulator
LNNYTQLAYTLFPMKKSKNEESKRRDLFTEVAEGMTELAEASAGKRTLRTHRIAYKATPKITPKELVRLRESLNLSRALFAVYLRTNVRTLENWEQAARNHMRRRRF